MEELTGRNQDYHRAERPHSNPNLLYGIEGEVRFDPRMIRRAVTPDFPVGYSKYDGSEQYRYRVDEGARNAETRDRAFNISQRSRHRSEPDVALQQSYSLPSDPHFLHLRHHHLHGNDTERHEMLQPSRSDLYRSSSMRESHPFHTLSAHDMRSAEPMRSLEAIQPINTTAELTRQPSMRENCELCARAVAAAQQREEAVFSTSFELPQARTEVNQAQFTSPPQPQYPQPQQFPQPGTFPMHVPDPIRQVLARKPEQQDMPSFRPSVGYNTVDLASFSRLNHDYVNEQIPERSSTIPLQLLRNRPRQSTYQSPYEEPGFSKHRYELPPKSQPEPTDLRPGFQDGHQHQSIGPEFGVEEEKYETIFDKIAKEQERFRMEEDHRRFHVYGTASQPERRDDLFLRRIVSQPPVDLHSYSHTTDGITATKVFPPFRGGFPRPPPPPPPPEELMQPSIEKMQQASAGMLWDQV